MFKVTYQVHGCADLEVIYFDNAANAYNWLDQNDNFSYLSIQQIAI